MVKSPHFVLEKLFLIIAWWAQVTLSPELSKIKVFRRGTPKGSKGEIPFGGQEAPSSISGDRLL